MNRHVVDVYASWMPVDDPLLIGQLTYAESNRGGVFSFAYDEVFLRSDYRLQIDPLLMLHSGELYNDAPDKNFRAFLDSSPDRWGRILMQRRAAIEYRKGLRDSSRLTELDYLLGVHDPKRVSAMSKIIFGSLSFLIKTTALMSALGKCCAMNWHSIQALKCFPVKYINTRLSITLF